MNKDKQQLWTQNNMDRIQKEYFKVAQVQKSVRPKITSLKIILVYVIIGSLWILLSDKALSMFVSDVDVIESLQNYKGWFYVVVTGLIFYFIIKKSLNLYKEAIDKVLLNYEDISVINEELIAMNEELDSQNEELKIAKERYSLVIAGYYDGIWDYDVLNDEYFLSEKSKQELGFENKEFARGIEDFESIVHEDEKQRVRKILSDYLSKKIDSYEIVYRVYNSDGEERWIKSMGQGVWDEKGNPIRIAGSHTDITEKITAEKLLEKYAYYDTLTNLPNKIKLEKTIEEFIKKAKPFIVMNIDIDNMKHINDMFGVENGDNYLKFIANSLDSELDDLCYVARIGGDELGVVVAYEGDYHDKIEEVFKVLRKPWSINSDLIYITSSVGISLYPEHNKKAKFLLQDAEIAMYKQKEKGKNGYTIFDASMYEETLKISKMNIELKKAVENEEFLLYYQPQYDMKTNEVIAMEALIRWLHPMKGFVPPMDFIPLAEKNGHIVQITNWVLKTAILQKRIWNEEGYATVKIAINISGYVLTNELAIDEICNLLQSLNVTQDEIELEITETAVMLDLEKAIKMLEKLRKFGVTVAMDDFGTGYSSLTYLHNIPFDILKMDGEFIRNVNNHKEVDFIFKTVIKLAHNMGLKVVAEGIETKEQVELLIENDCDIGQGYYYNRPMPANKIEEVLKTEKQFL